LFIGIAGILPLLVIARLSSGTWFLRKRAVRDEVSSKEGIRMHEFRETDDQKAIRLLERQIDRLVSIPEFLDARFVGWFDTSRNLLAKLLGPTSNTLQMFNRISWSPKTKQTLSSNYANSFASVEAAKTDAHSVFNVARTAATALLNSGIEHIKEFGVYAQPQPTSAATQTGGVHQNFYGNVTIENQAIAADNAIQNVDQSSHVGPDLREIRKLLSESLEITGRQFGDALQAIEKIASETRKPEKGRDWKSMATWGATLVGIVSKASDVAVRVGPHMMAVMQYIETGAKHFGL
jgi:hypothetical protein